MNRFLYTLFPFVLWIAGFHKIYGQENVGPLGDQPPMRHYTSENGLPQNSVKGIVKDPNGFIWMVTEGGLVRFDGHKFKTFEKSTLKTLSNRYSMFLSSLVNKDLYAVNELNQYVRIRGGGAVMDQFYFNKIIRSFDPQKADTVSSHFSAAAPNSYINNSDYKYIVITANAPGNYWICYHNKAEYFLQWKKTFTATFKNERLIANFFRIGDNLFYHEKNGSIIPISKNSADFFPVTGDILENPDYNPAKRTFKVFWNNLSNQAFLYLNRKLYLLETTENNRLRTSEILQNFDLESNLIRSIHYDKNYKRLFLGSITNGLYVFNKKDFETIKAKNGNDRYLNIFYSQAIFGNNSLVTSKGIILGKDPATTKAFDARIPQIYSGNNVEEFCISNDLDGNIWNKKDDSLFEYNKHATKMLHSWHVKGDIKTLFVDKEGIIWIGTKSEGLLKKSKQLTDPQIVVPGSILKNITYIQRWANTLFIATKNGLYQADILSYKARLIGGTERLNIRSLYCAAPDQIWITTYEDGFFLYSNRSVVKLPLDKNKYLLTSHCIVEDKKGFFWITTNRGLLQTKKMDLLSFAAKQKGDVFYMYYGKDMGFATNEFNGGCQPCALRLPNQSVSLPTMDGFVWFVPENIQPELPKDSIVIDRYEVDGKLHAPTNNITLDKNAKHIKIYLSTPYFGDKNNVYLSYAFNNLKKSNTSSWITLDEDESAITIENLKHGDYVISIRKIAGFGLSNYTFKNIHICVIPAWYEKSWFISVCVAILVFVFYLIVQITTKNIKQKNKQLESGISKRTSELEQAMLALKYSENKLSRQFFIQSRMVASISHDIRTPLKYIAFSADQVVSKTIHQKHDQVICIGENIKQSADKMQRMLENMIEYSKTYIQAGGINLERVNLHDLIAEKFALFSEILSEAKNETFNLVTPSLIVQSNPQILSIIVHNLIDNCNKYCYNGSIIAYTEYHDGQLHLIISDDGAGIPEKIAIWLDTASFYTQNKHLEEITPQNYHGLGLFIVKDLSTILKLTIAVRHQQKGTNIHLIFPSETTV